jgi:exopolysaccharide production protein ExoQ
VIHAGFDPPPHVKPSRARAGRALERLLSRIESVLLVVALLLIAINKLPGGGSGDQDRDPVMQVLFRVLYPLAAIGLALMWRSSLRAVRAHPWTVVLTLFAAASLYWSILPDETMRRSVSILGSTFVGLYLGARFEPARVVRIVAWSLGLAAVFSIAAVVAWPAVGLSERRYVGAWQGIFPHKNVMGRAMVLGVMTFLYLFMVSTRRRWIPGVGLVLCGILVLMSNSQTAVLAAAVLAMAAPLYNVWRSRRPGSLLAAAVAFMAAAAVALLFTASLDDAFAVLGRDTTLTGRTELWEAVIAEIGQRPLIGHGYGAFWTEWSDPANTIFKILNWRTPHAHNGFMDLTLELGLAGLGLFFVSFLALSARTARALRRGGAPEALWVALFLTFMLVYNLTESTLMRYGSLFWILYVAAAAGTWRWAAAARRPPVSRSHAGLSPGVRMRMTHAQQPARTSVRARMAQQPDEPPLDADS